MQNQQQTDSLIPVPEACRILGNIGKTKFYELVKEGKIHIVKIGKKSTTSKNETHSLVESYKEGAA